jgi:hypothetical protein
VDRRGRVLVRRGPVFVLRHGSRRLITSRHYLINPTACLLPKSLPSGTMQN